MKERETTWLVFQMLVIALVVGGVLALYKLINK
jgi:hypothetical protein